MQNWLFQHSAEAHAAAVQDWADSAHYAADNRQLAAAGDDPLRIVLMGDSITQFWAECHPAFFERYHLVGRGIKRQVTSQMLCRYRQDVLALRPRAVVITCGTNDIAQNMGPYVEDVTIDNITSMAQLALRAGVQVVLTTVTPCAEFYWNPTLQDVPRYIASLNQRIAAVATTLGVPMIDYFTPMAGEKDELPLALSEDGAHPNAAGYQVMERELLAALRELYGDQLGINDEISTKNQL